MLVRNTGNMIRRNQCTYFSSFIVHANTNMANTRIVCLICKYINDKKCTPQRFILNYVEIRGVGIKVCPPEKAEFFQMNNSSFNKKFSLIGLNMNTLYKVGTCHKIH